MYCSGTRAHALPPAGKEPPGQGPADALPDDPAPAAVIRLDPQPDVPEHAVPAGLFLVAAFDPGTASDRLAVGDVRLPGHHGRPELALQAFADDGDLVLALRVEHLLAGLDGPFEADRGLLLEQPCQRGAQLVEVGLRLRLDGHRQRRPGELEGREAQRALAARERGPGLRIHEFGHGADLPRADLADSLLLLAVEEQELADALILPARRIPGVVVVL